METRQRAPANTIPLGLAFDTAVLRHQEGRLREADGLYRETLRFRPEHPGSWHHLGLIAQRRGNLAEALQRREFSSRAGCRRKNTWRA